MANSSSNDFNKQVEEISQIKDTLYNSLSSAGKHAMTIANIIGGVNYELSSNWKGIRADLDEFAELIRNNLEGLFTYIEEQMNFLASIEENMNTTATAHRDQTKSIMDELRSKLSKGAAAAGAGMTGNVGRAVEAGAAAAGAGMAGNVGRAVEAGIAGAGATGRVGDAVSSAITAAGAAAANAGENN